MISNFALSVFTALYSLIWRILIPFLRRNPRLRDGWEDRTLQRPLPAARIWIQASSGGEAYLAIEIIRHLTRHPLPSILVTTNTRQGMDILSGGLPRAPGGQQGAHLAYFPFDHPGIMARAVRRIRPAIAVLLETEIWPGMLMALQKNGVPAIILNGRLSARSLNRYRIWPRFLETFGPRFVFAVTEADARRFRRLPGSGRVAVMPNVKFDRMGPAANLSSECRTNLSQHDRPFVVMGSVRVEEAADVMRMAQGLCRDFPEILIGLFPRHLHRLPEWETALRGAGLKWIYRTRMTSDLSAIQVILWDRFGELIHEGYAKARAAFVGGSLAPLGGQNFLEAAMAGVRPVIGPSWHDFHWLGEGIFREKLAYREKNGEDVLIRLIRLIRDPVDREEIRQRTAAYIRSRQGGAAFASRVVTRHLFPNRRN